MSDRGLTAGGGGAVAAAGATGRDGPAPAGGVTAGRAGPAAGLRGGLGALAAAGAAAGWGAGVTGADATGTGGAVTDSTSVGRPTKNTAAQEEQRARMPRTGTLAGSTLNTVSHLGQLTFMV
jgi:hypothetical protein